MPVAGVPVDVFRSTMLAAEPLTVPAAEVQRHASFGRTVVSMQHPRKHQRVVVLQRLTLGKLLDTASRPKCLSEITGPLPVNVLCRYVMLSQLSLTDMLAHFSFRTSLSTEDPVNFVSRWDRPSTARSRSACLLGMGASSIASTVTDSEGQKGLHILLLGFGGL